MIRLHQTFGAHTGRVIELDREVIRFGRLPDNEVAFDPHADLDASGRHAEIRREGDAWVLIDVGSRNGTHVGGKRVTRHPLTSGDEIEFGIGGPRVRVEIVGDPVRPGGSRPGVATAAATPIAPQSPAMQAPAFGQATPAPYASPMPGQPMPGQPMPGQPMPGQPMPGPSSQQSPGSGGPRYGQRTVGMMIQAAVEQAERQRAQGGNRSTAFLRAVATEAAHSSSRGLKMAVALLTVLLMLTLAAVVALFFYARWQERRLRDENVSLQHELAELGDGQSGERDRLEHRLQELNEQLHESQDSRGAHIAAANDEAVYILISRHDDRREVVCSAFAVRPDLLATNAHCVSAVERELARRRDVSVVANHGRGPPIRVARMWRHPMFVSDRPVPSPDVGLIRVDGTLPKLVHLATVAQLPGLHVGDDIFVYGFPSQIADTGAPVAVLTSGVIGRMTAFDGTDAPPARRFLVSHSAFTEEGTAGSPIFDRRGRVVAINAGNYRARTRVTDTGTHVTRTVEGETAYAWAVRVDLLLQLLAGMPQ